MSIVGCKMEESVWIASLYRVVRQSSLAGKTIESSLVVEFRNPGVLVDDEENITMAVKQVVCARLPGWKLYGVTRK